MPISFALALAINTAVNNSTVYLPDNLRFGSPEYWEAANGRGDCEDYALTKRMHLLVSGAPIDAVRLATAWDENGGYHAVLVVTTDEGDYVLDNRFPEPLARHELQYKWDKIQCGKKWCAVLP